MFSTNPPRVQVGLKEISLDHPGELAFVSHAHSDHALAAKAPSLLASRETIDLMRARGYKATERIEHEHYGTKLLNAGHVLGARQLVAETEGEGGNEVFAYTGDFRFADSLCVKAAEVPKCDTLVMEATFGSPEFVFPDRDAIARELADWVVEQQKQGIVVLGGYALGKAQELTKILNDYAGIIPVVEEQIASINDVYNNHGVKLDFLRTSSEEGMRELDKNFVAIVPMNKVNNNFAFELSRAYSKRVSSAVATGWALTERFASRTRAFCISDHSDFPELVRFAEESGARKVFTKYGYAGRLASELRKKGIEAHSLEQKQTLLSLY